MRPRAPSLSSIRSRFDKDQRMDIHLCSFRVFLELQAIFLQSVKCVSSIAYNSGEGTDLIDWIAIKPVVSIGEKLSRVSIEAFDNQYSTKKTNFSKINIPLLRSS